MRKIALYLLLLVFNTQLQATKYYVNDGATTNDVYCSVVGNNGNNGLTPATPKATLTNLLSTYSASFAAGDTIFVDAGTYTDRDLSSPVNGVVIKGAGVLFTTFNLSGSDHYFMLINDNNTVLSDMKVHGFDNQTISGVQSIGIASNITGIQINNVQVDGDATTSTAGGYPIEIASGAGVSFNGGGVTCNSWDAGGGIQISGATTNVSIRNYQFIGNYQLWGNGTALKINNGIVNVYNSRFEYNTIGGDKSGMGIDMSNGTVRVYDSYFNANETNILSNSVGGAISIHGGNFLITRSKITNNVPESATSGIYGAGIGVTAGTVGIDSCYFSGNSGARANDVYVKAGTVNARNCTFGSSANQIGIAGGSFTIANCGSPSEYGAGIVHTNTTAPSYTANPTLPDYLPVTCLAIPCTTPSITSASASGTICSGTTFNTNLAASTTSAQTTYSWTSSAVAGITGHSTSGTGNIHETLVNTTGAQQNVVYTITPTFNLSCNGPSVSYTVTVQPAVTMTSSTTATVCSGNALNLALTSNVSANYSWLANDNSNTNGESISAQSGSTINDNITNNSTSSQVVTYNVTPTSVSGNCAGTTQTVSVTVYPTPVVNALSNPSSGCASSTISAYAFTTTPSGAGISWTNDNTNTGMSASGSTNPIPGFTAANVSNTETSVISITPTLGSCTGPASTYTLVINPNPTFSSSGTAVNPSSCGGNNGSITGVTVVGAPTITYSWNSGTYNTADISGLIAGNYNLQVTDGNGCTAAASYSLTDPSAPAAPAFSINNTNVCEGASVVLSITNPQVGETYNWFGPSGSLGSGNTITINPVGQSDAGQYNASTSALGCTGSVSASPITLVVNENPVFTISSTATSFCEDTTVTLSANITNPGGTATIPVGGYQWVLNGNPYPGGTEANLETGSTGVYELTVTNSNGCSSVYSSVTLNNYSEPHLSLSAATIDSSDCNASTGNINGVLVGSGTADYIFNWYDANNNLVANNISTTGTTSLNTQAAGAYQLIVIDANGCNDTIQATIPSYNSPNAPLVLTNNPSCSGTGINPVTVTNNGGVINWYTDSLLITFIGTGNPFTPNVTATDTLYATELLHNCESAGTMVIINVNQTPASPLSPDVSYCQGDLIQDLTANGNGGTYTWYADTALTTILGTGSPFQSGITATDTLYLTETSNGCESEGTIVHITIHALPASPIITASGPLTFCAGDSVVISVSPGTGILWNPGTLTDSTITVSSSTSLTATYTDVYGCSSTSAPITVVVNNNPSAPALNTNAVGNAFCTGDSILLHSNPTSGITWNNGSTDSTLLTSTGGVFYATYTDLNGCTSDTSFITVAENSNPAAPNLSLSAGTQSFCAGDSATISASPTIGITWSNGSTASSITVTTAGNYSAYITDNNGCESPSASMPITVNPLPNAPNLAVTSGNQIFCTGGSATISATPASGITWSNGSTNASITVTAGGTYSANYTDNNGCISADADIVITENPNPSAPSLALSSGNGNLCQGDSTIISATPGNGINWNNGNTGSAITVSTSGTYSATYTDANNCTSPAASITVTVNPLPDIGLAMNIDAATCGNNNGGINNISVSNGTMPYNYAWQQNGVTISNDTILNNAGTGNYILIVTDANGCADTSGAINVPSTQGIDIDLSSDVYNGTEALDAHLTSTTLTGTPVSYQWILNQTALFTGVDSSYSLTGLMAGTYTAAVIVTSLDGCTDADSVIIVVDEPLSVIIPNVFTPNGDNINEVFAIKATGLKEMSITIFDRWGLKMYEQEGKNLAWDGKTPASLPASDGTYYFIFAGKDSKETPIEKTGYLLLTR